MPRLRVLVLAALLCLGAPARAEPGWEPVAEDAAGDVEGPLLGLGADPRADLVEVALREADGMLQVRLTTAGGPGLPTFPLPLPPLPAPGPTAYESVVAFRVESPSAGAVPFELRASTREGFLLVRGGQVLGEDVLDVEPGSTPSGYVAGIPRWLLFPRGLDDPARVTGLVATLDARPSQGPSTQDRAPDEGEGRDFPLAAPSPLDFQARWRRLEGADYAGGPSVAAGPDGSVHVAYVVYRAELGKAKGLYHATLSGGRLVAERVADARMPTDLHEDRKTQTALAVDEAGVVHVLWEPSPNEGGPGEVRYATGRAGDWRVEDPAALAGASPLRVEDSVRAHPALAVGAGRVVAALQLVDGGTALVERGANGWVLLHALRDARLARVALAPGGGVHVAFLRPTSDQSPDRAVFGDLRHAAEEEGWRETLVAEQVEDRTKFWQSSEADGSFAFALDPRGAPHFAYETDRGERGYAILREGRVERHATPLVADHGNIQNRMRMAIDREGRAHVVTGYGGADLYAVRSPEGGWHVERLETREAFSLALAPDGRALLAYTQPHGGTTLGLDVQVVGVETPGAAEGPPDPRLPVPGLGMVGAVVALALAGLLLRRRG